MDSDSQSRAAKANARRREGALHFWREILKDVPVFLPEKEPQSNETTTVKEARQLPSGRLWLKNGSGEAFPGEVLACSGKQEQIIFRNLETAVGTYANAVVNFEDVALLEVEIDREQLESCLRKLN
mmetsp:Transcript_10797/g.13505  ORF Transcript_10797/g.13505 Transcript_10797/m.13505 type:complete len:126 (+) Transcript_10797:68-445(+)